MGVEPEHGAHDVLEVAAEPFGTDLGGGEAGAGGQTGDDLREPGAHAGVAGTRAQGGEAGDAGGVVARTEGVVAEHHVEPRDGDALGVVHGEPGRVPDDVEAGVLPLPARGEAGRQQPVDLDAPVQFLAEVLPAGVGDAYAEGELEHDPRPGPVHGADGGSGVPVLAVRAEVVDQTGLGEGADLGAVEQVGGLPGVYGDGDGAGGRAQPCGVRGEQLLGGGRAVLGPGGVGGGQRPVDGEPVEREGAVDLGRVAAGLRLGESFAALGRGVEGVAEQQGLFGGEEEVGLGGVLRGAPPLFDEAGGVAYGVGHARDQVDRAPVAALAPDEDGDGGGVGGRGAGGGVLQGGCAEAVGPGGGPVVDGHEEGGAARGEGDAQGVALGPREVVLPGPAAQQALRTGRVGGPQRVRVVERVGGHAPAGRRAGARGGRVRGKAGVARGFLAGHDRRLDRAGGGRSVLPSVPGGPGAVGLGCGGGVHGVLPCGDSGFRWWTRRWSDGAGSVRPLPARRRDGRRRRPPARR